MWMIKMGIMMADVDTATIIVVVLELAVMTILSFEIVIHYILLDNNVIFLLKKFLLKV